MPESKVLMAYRQDLKQGDSAGEEFPVTRMSGSLALGLDSLLSKSTVPFRRALDLGTGCGVHAAVLAAGGVSNVLAVDINARAVTLAAARYERLRERIGISGAVVFAHSSLDQIAGRSEVFDLLVTNPPSFYRPARSRRSSSAIADGVFDGSDADKASDSYLYQLFDKVVRKCLAPGGVLVCAWPGLQYRLVHNLSHPKAPIAHPLDLLEQWFEWKFDCDDRDPERFYQYDAVIHDYGLGDAFLAGVTADIDRGGKYSALVRAGNKKNNWNPTYKFGLLSLRKLDDAHFSIIQFDEAHQVIDGVRP